MSQVIIVGGGLAGHSAAHVVLQNGGKVLLLDKSPFCGGNSTKATSGINAAGTITQRKLNIPDTPEIFEQDTLVSGAERANPELIHVLTHESGPAVDWLMTDFNLDLSILARLAAHSHKRTHRGKEKFPGMAITFGLMEAYEEICQKEPHRARLVNKAKVVELVQDQTTKEVTGVVFEKGGKRYTENGIVILATGGYGADFSESSLLAQISDEFAELEAWSVRSRAAKQSNGKKVPMPPLLTLPTTNGPHCTGDGIKLGLAAGSGTTDLAFIQIHPTGIVDPNEPDAKVKFLAAEALRGSGGIILNRHGKRICDELGKRDYVSGRMFLNEGPFRLCLNGKASDLIAWHCEHYRARGLMKEMTGEELAKACNTTAAELQKEFDDYNKAAQNPGTDKWGKKFFEATPVMVNDKFNVCEITPLVHYCMGGLKTNGKAEILRDDATPIPGLFGAGEILGGIHGSNRLGGSSLLDCVVYGRVAGRSASKYLMNKLLAGGAGVSAGAGIDIKVSPNDQSVTISWSGKKQQSASALPQDDGEKEVDPNQAFYDGGVTSEKKSAAGAGKKITAAELAKHNNKDDCWVSLFGKVYDITSFLPDHPGGVKVIELQSGKDATEVFLMAHTQDMIAKYIGDLYIGDLEQAAKL